MNEFISTLKNGALWIIGMVGAFISRLFGGWTSSLTVLVMLMVLDYVMGLVVAGVFKKSPKTESGALESRAGWQGLCRKGGTLAIAWVACQLDYIMGTNYLRDAVAILYIANEIISIIENAGLIGIPIPKIIQNAIEILKRRAGEGADKEDENGD